MRKNVVFVGFMASGKTSVSREVARRLKLGYVSTDELIVEKAGKSIQKIFEEHGERFFRALEMEAVKEVSRMRNVVVDCGGGVVLHEDNVSALKGCGIIFLLHATPETIFERSLKEPGSRPLLGANYTLEDVRRILMWRMPFYLNAADYVVDTTGRSVEEVADKVIHVLKEEMV